MVGHGVGRELEWWGELCRFAIENRGNRDANFGMCLLHLENEPLTVVERLEMAERDLLQVGKA